MGGPVKPDVLLTDSVVPVFTTSCALTPSPVCTNIKVALYILDSRNAPPMADTGWWQECIRTAVHSRSRGGYPPPPGPPLPLPFQCLRLTAKFCFGAKMI